jgi:hypothetical protein
LLEEAPEVAHRNGEEYYEAELYRIKGEVLLSVGTRVCHCASVRALAKVASVRAPCSR